MNIRTEARYEASRSIPALTGKLRMMGRTIQQEYSYKVYDQRGCLMDIRTEWRDVPQGDEQ